MSKRSFEEELRHKASEYTPVPRDGMWNAIERELPPEKKRKRGFYYRIMGVAAVLLFVALIPFMTGPVRETRMVSDSKTPAAGLTETPVQKEPAALSDKTALLAGAGGQMNPAVTSTPRHDKTIQNRAAKLSAKKAPTLASSDPVPEDISIPEPAIQTEVKPSVPGSEATIEVAGAEVTEAKDSSPGSLIADAPQVKPEPDEKSDSPRLAAKPVSRPSFFAGAVFLPGISSTRVGIDAGKETEEPFASTYKARENYDRSRYAWQAGVYFGMGYKRSALTLGLNYQQLAYQMPVVNTNSNIMRGISSNFVNFDYEATDSFKVSAPAEGGYYISNRFRYLSVPLGYRYTFLQKRRLSVDASVALQFNFLISYRGLLAQNESGLYVKQRTAGENHIASFYAGLGLGPVLRYDLSQRTRLLLMPQYGTSLTALEKGIVSTGIHTWSLGVGMEWRFCDHK